MCQGFRHFSGLLHHFVLAKLGTSSTCRVKPSYLPSGHSIFSPPMIMFMYLNEIGLYDFIVGLTLKIAMTMKWTCLTLHSTRYQVPCLISRLICCITLLYLLSPNGANRRFAKLCDLFPNMIRTIK